MAASGLQSFPIEQYDSFFLIFLHIIPFSTVLNFIIQFSERSNGSEQIVRNFFRLRFETFLKDFFQRHKKTFY